MKTLIKTSFVVAALAAACSSAFAKTENLGTLTSDGTSFGNAFYSATPSFTDIFNFTIGGAGSVYGFTQDYEANIFLRDVNLSSLELVSQSTGQSYFLKTNVPDTYVFNIGGLSAGDYALKVSGSVSSGIFDYLNPNPATYQGMIATTASVASPAPEPAAMAVTMLGLVGVAALARARKQRG